MSQGYGVMSRETSLLVLESQAMFDAFGVDRGQPQTTWSGEEQLEEVAGTGTVAMDPAPKNAGRRHGRGAWGAGHRQCAAAPSTGGQARHGRQGRKSDDEDSRRQEAPATKPDAPAHTRARQDKAATRRGGHQGGGAQGAPAASGISKDMLNNPLAGTVHAGPGGGWIELKRSGSARRR